jgi:2-oxoglutarate dehydrogenase E2 component (dihydrolipoamide succinyltransferase)
MLHEIKIPSVGESITSATLGAWHKAEGAYVRAGEVILTIETDKITTELESDRSGTLHHLAAVGDELAIGAPVASIDESAAAPADAAPAASAPAKEEAPANASDAAKVKATPVARKVAEGEGVDLNRVSGTGTGGKITKADVLDAASVKTTEPMAPVVEAAVGAKRTSRKKMSPLRRKIATHLVNAQHEARARRERRGDGVGDAVAARGRVRERHARRRRKVDGAVDTHHLKHIVEMHAA